MTRTRERLVPALVAFAVLLVGGLMTVLLNDARDSGIEALEDALVGEVSAIARSQDQRVASSLSGTAGLANRPWELTRGSETDRQILDSLLQFVPDLPTGFFVTDADLIITQGVNLADPSIIGDRFEREGAAELLASSSFLSGVGGYLPVNEGITAAIPTVGLMYPIIDPATFSLRGTFVFESEVAADSSFNEEISGLSRGETGRYLFYDGNGRIIAANDPALIAEQVDDFLVDAPAGIDNRDGDVIVVEDVPSAGWRVAFRQDRDEFESGLSGPLQSAGRVVVISTIAVGGLLFLVLARRLRAAREEQLRLHKLNETQEEFISIVSHELRTPVAGVLGFLQTSLDHWDTLSDDARRAAVTRSASNARRLQSLTRDVLDSQAAESGRMAFSMDTTDVTEEVAVAVQAAQSLYPDHQFEIDIPSNPVYITADVDRIQQVLTNLLDNAARISPPTEPIHVSMVTLDGSVQIDVRDRGPGIAADAVDTIFDKFVRGSVGAVSGTGLGLYISRQIVEAHGGTIAATSEVGAGARFRVVLPQEHAPAAS